MTGSAPVLDVRNLTVEFSTEDGILRAVDNVSFQIQRGEIVGLVGESGAGKSLTSEAVLGLIRRPPGRVAGTKRPVPVSSRTSPPRRSSRRARPLSVSASGVT